MFVVFFYIPFALLAVLYSIILIKQKTQVFPGEQSANAQEQRARRNGNILKMAIAIVLGFLLCFLPDSTIVLLTFFTWDGTSVPCGITHLIFITLYLVYANCAINPCICFIFSGNYRQGLKRLLNCTAQV